MPDVKTTINALRYTLRLLESHSVITVSCNDFFTDMLKDTLDVIEEQSRTINRLNESHKVLLEQYKELNKKYFEKTIIYGTDAKIVGNVVLCRDCIWFHKPKDGTKKQCKCNYHGGVTKEDRYCWWGEKDA